MLFGDGDESFSAVDGARGIFNILTPEQRTTFQNKMKETKAKIADVYKKCGKDE